MIAEKFKKGFVAGEGKLRGDLLDVSIAITKDRFCASKENSVNEDASTRAPMLFANAGKMVVGISKGLGYVTDLELGGGIDADPLVDLFCPFVSRSILFPGKTEKIRKSMEQNGIDQLPGSIGEIAIVKKLLEKIGSIKMLKIPFFKGKLSRKNVKMKPVKANSLSVLGSVMTNSGREQ